MWKLACARRHTSPTSAYIASHLNKVAAGMQLVEAGLQAIQHPASPARPHRKSPEQGGQRGCSLWKLACARSAYQNSLSILSCIPAMHLPPPRTALAREPHATAPVPGPHDAHDAARAAYAYETGMRTQHRPATPARAPRGASWRVRNWYAYAGKLMYPGGVTATAPGSCTLEG